jgi:predicted nuclease with TOPRIM domain
LKDQLEGQINNYRERMSSLQQEFENVNDDRVKLLDDMDVLKKKLQSAQQEKEAAQRKYQKEVC